MELKKYKLADIADFNKSSISRSETFKEIIYLDTSSITENVVSGTVIINTKEAPSRAQRKVTNNTIIYSTVRPRLKHYGILRRPQNNFIVSTGFATIDIKDLYKDKIDPRYLYLLLTQPAITNYIGNIADTAVSAYPSINPSDLSSLCFMFPDYDIQKTIADIWNNYDYKIEINRAINQNLEAMAKQLYDYWFVQFDFPNEERKPYKSSGGEMVWNEKLKRKIPKGWDNCTLEHFLTIKNGRDHKHLAEGVYPVYGSGGEMRRVNENLYRGESVLMPRKGTLNNIMYVDEAFWTVDTMFYSEMKVPYCAKYIFFAIKDIDFTRWDSGTGVPSMTASTLYNLPMIKPHKDLLKRFDKTITPIFYKMKQIRVECEELTKQRDELLPLLMNGQVSVNSDLAKCISEIGIVAIIRNYPNSLLKYWRLVIIYKCRITFSYNFSSHSASLPLLSQTSNTSSDRLLPLRLVCGRPMEGRRWSHRHRRQSVQVVHR